MSPNFHPFVNDGSDLCAICGRLRGSLPHDEGVRLPPDAGVYTVTAPRVALEAEIVRSSKEIASLRSEVDRLRKTLEFYAEKANWRSDLNRPVTSTGSHRASVCESDYGNSARIALSTPEVKRG